MHAHNAFMVLLSGETCGNASLNEAVKFVNFNQKEFIEYVLIDFATNPEFDDKSSTLGPVLDLLNKQKVRIEDLYEHTHGLMQNIPSELYMPAMEVEKVIREHVDLRNELLMCPGC